MTSIVVIFISKDFKDTGVRAHSVGETAKDLCRASNCFINYFYTNGACTENLSIASTVVTSRHLFGQAWVMLPQCFHLGDSVEVASNVIYLMRCHLLVIDWSGIRMD